MGTTKVEMSLLSGIVEKIISTVKTLFNVSGDAPMFACRAWVLFNGTTTVPTILGSGNVSSVVKNSSGDFRIHFTEPMPDINYCIEITTGYNSVNFGTSVSDRRDISTEKILAIQTGYINTAGSSVFVDPHRCNIVVYR